MRRALLVSAALVGGGHAVPAARPCPAKHSGAESDDANALIAGDPDDPPLFRAADPCDGTQKIKGDLKPMLRTSWGGNLTVPPPSPKPPSPPPLSSPPPPALPPPFPPNPPHLPSPSPKPPPSPPPPPSSPPPNPPKPPNPPPPSPPKSPPPPSPPPSPPYSPPTYFLAAGSYSCTQACGTVNKVCDQEKLNAAAASVSVCQSILGSIGNVCNSGAGQYPDDDSGCTYHPGQYGWCQLMKKTSAPPPCQAVNADHYRRRVCACSVAPPPPSSSPPPPFPPPPPPPPISPSPPPAPVHDYWAFGIKDDDDIVSIKSGPTTDSNMTEVHVLTSASSADSVEQYRKFSMQTGTALGLATGYWAFEVMGNGDVVGIKMGPTTGSGTTEVHILSASSKYKSFKLQTGTALHIITDPENWSFGVKSNGDVVVIKRGPVTATSRTEVHVLSAAANYKSFSLQTATLLPLTYSRYWHFCVTPTGDVAGIKMGPTTGTGSTEIHVLSAVSNYQKFIVQQGTMLHLINNPESWSFVIKPNGDVVAMNRGPTATNTTEVHVLSVADNYGKFSLQIGTALPMTSPFMRSL